MGNLTSNNWLHSMHWKLMFLKNKMRKEWNKRPFLLEFSQIGQVVGFRHLCLLNADRAAVKEADAFQKSGIGQIFIIVREFAEEVHFQDMEHANFIWTISSKLLMNL